MQKEDCPYSSIFVLIFECKLGFYFPSTGKLPSDMIVNCNPVEMGNNVPAPPPDIKDSDTDAEAMSKTIQKLRRDLEDEKKKNEILHEKNQKTKKENADKQKLLDKQTKRIEKILSKEISEAEKKRIVKELLQKNTKFTIVGHFCYQLSSLQLSNSGSFTYRSLLIFPNVCKVPVTRFT